MTVYDAYEARDVRRSSHFARKSRPRDPLPAYPECHAVDWSSPLQARRRRCKLVALSHPRCSCGRTAEEATIYNEVPPDAR
jgi:hypothetical protein